MATRPLTAVLALAGLFVSACTEAPSGIRTPRADVSLGKIPPGPGPSVGTANIEFFEVCKTYLGQVGPAVTIDVAVSGVSAPTNFQVTLANGECRDIWLHGGAADVVTVTEQVPVGYTTSYVREVATRTSYTVDPSVSGNSASGNVSGAPGEGVVVKFTNTFTPPPPPPPPSCTLTQGYWKNHTEDWDQLSDNRPFLSSDLFYNSSTSYITILQTPPSKGNAYLQLAHQFIAARLNVGGAPSSGVSAVDAALSGAAAYFGSAPAGIPNPSGALRTQLQGWATTLDNFNNGITGPGHCD